MDIPLIMRTVDKPWGNELIWAETDRYVGKILHVKTGHSLSLQYHVKKDETVMVLSGKMAFTHYFANEEPRGWRRCTRRRCRCRTCRCCSSRRRRTPASSRWGCRCRR